MNRKQYLLLVALTIVCGLIGGAVSNRVFMARSAVAQGVPANKEVVSAKRFILTDDKGNIRSTWGVTAEDKAEISFIDRNGELRVCLDEVSIGFLYRNRKPRAVINEDGIGFFNKNGKVCAAMLIKSNGTSLTLADEHGNVQATLGTNSILGTNFALCDKNGKARVATGVDDSDVVFSELYDKDGKVMWSAP